MANPDDSERNPEHFEPLEHLAILEQGVENWNKWRQAEAKQLNGWRANLKWARLWKANLRGANLSGVDLTRANLSEADLSGTNLRRANLSGADLSGTNFAGANLNGATLRNARLYDGKLSGASLIAADLQEAKLWRVDLRGADLRKANMRAADLQEANLTNANLQDAMCVKAVFTNAAFVGTNFKNADLTGARVYGISAWDLQLTGTVQQDLIITPAYAPSVITVDDLEIAQFIYLLLNNQRIRKVIDTITSKVVLILGRFTPERKAVLDAVREELRNRDYLPVVFDFEKPSTQTTMDTVLTLAGMARFVVADVTDPKSVLQELQGIVPSRPRLPVQPILLRGAPEPPMFDYIKAFPSVLDTQYYETTSELLANLAERVIGPAERRLEAARAAV